jgi:hypothetical protein
MGRTIFLGKVEPDAELVGELAELVGALGGVEWKGG